MGCENAISHTESYSIFSEFSSVYNKNLSASQSVCVTSDHCLVLSRKSF